MLLAHGTGAVGEDASKAYVDISLISSHLSIDKIYQSVKKKDRDKSKQPFLTSSTLVVINRPQYNKIDAFEILINNDEKGDILVTAYQLWVDGEPFESFRRQPLSRRGTYKLKFSNLVSDLILNHQMPIVAYIYRPL